jgi:hypothetical protein
MSCVQKLFHFLFGFDYALLEYQSGCKKIVRIEWFEGKPLVGVGPRGFYQECWAQPITRSKKLAKYLVDVETGVKISHEIQKQLQ